MHPIETTPPVQQQVPPPGFLPFADARLAVRALKLSSAAAWRALCTDGERPTGVPSNPMRAYSKSGWAGWGDFLGTGRKCRRRFRAFTAARTFARQSGVRSAAMWKQFAAGKAPQFGAFPNDVPSNPQFSYARDWVSWPDFLGTAQTQDITDSVASAPIQVSEGPAGVNS